MSGGEKIKIQCPKCKTEISVDEVLAGQIEAKNRLKFEAELEAEKKKMIPKALEWAKSQVKEENEKKSKELEQIKEALEKEKHKRAEAEEVELKLRKERQQFEEDQRAWKIQQQRQLDEERAKIREEIDRKAEESHRLKEAEMAKKLTDALRANEDLRRKLEQGSQQTQGEVLELELETILKTEFPVDLISPVPKGINGADIIQTIIDTQGRQCGSIAWEMKRTKAWSDGWIQKLKDDQRKIKAEIAVLVSEVLPAGMIRIGLYQGVYVVVPEAALGLAQILRIDIIKLAASHALAEGRSEKKEVIYNYLCGTEFRGRVEAIVESMVSLRESLGREKRAYQKLWSEREKQIERAESNMIGMYGDMQGIAGRTLPQIKSLELETGDDGLESIIVEETIELVTDPPQVEPDQDKGLAQQLQF